MSRSGKEFVKLPMINVVDPQVLRHVTRAGTRVVIDNVNTIDIVKGQRVKLPGYVPTSINRI